MCGITGFFQKNKNIEFKTIKRMNDKIVHRGPDDEGYLIVGEYDGSIANEKVKFINSNINFAFGHRRLSIQDLSSAGHQPMSYKDRYWIVYNGEIYNFLELKNELIALNYTFANHTDTEVIMAAYDAWGVDCLNKFNGMWAFVLFDTQTEKIFISRDRFGIKPLYYYQDDENFVFASEIKSILEHPIVQTNPNEKYLDDYIQNGPKEYLKETAFKDIYRFDFASYFLGSFEDLTGSFKSTKFWTIKPNLSTERFDEQKAKEYAKQYYELLEDAVRLRLRADVKVGSALSGGLDSSSIVYLVNKILKEQGKEELQETFSSVYHTPGTEHCDESIYINEIAKELNVKSNQIEPLEKDVPQEHEKVIYMMENPPETTLMSSWHTFKLVAQSNVKVTLDGQGADEQLGGYFPYIRYYLSSLSFFDLLSETKAILKMPVSKKIVFVGFMLGLLRNTFGSKFSTWIVQTVLKKQFSFNLNQKLAEDIQKSLATLIHYADHTSMAFSIESRMPFMDYRMVEFLASVPASYKMHHGWTKYIARVAFDGKLPDSVTWRKDKMGWLLPEDFWFRGNLRMWFINQFSDSNEKEKVLQLLNSKLPIKFSIRHLNVKVFENTFLGIKK